MDFNSNQSDNFETDNQTDKSHETTDNQTEKSHSKQSDNFETDNQTDKSHETTDNQTEKSHQTEDSQQVQELANKILQMFVKASQRRFTFLLMGRTGVGKSSTINTLMAQDIAPVGDDEPTTFTVESFDAEAYDIPFRVIDTPGLCDDLPEKGNDQKYISIIQDNIEQLDCLWFVTNLGATRVGSDEKRAIKLIHQAFGSKIWDHAIIVFTFADLVKPDKFAEKLSKRTQLIRQEIAQYAGEQVANKVPSVAVDNESKTTPDGKQWLGQLYTTVFTQMNENALSFLMATAPRLKTDDSTNQSAETETYGGSYGGGYDGDSSIYVNPQQEESMGKKFLNVLQTTLGIVGKAAQVFSIVSPALKAAAPLISKGASGAGALIGKAAPAIAKGASVVGNTVGKAGSAISNGIKAVGSFVGKLFR
jgi:predicted GTPase